MPPQNNLENHITYRGQLYSAQSIVKKDPGRTRKNSLAIAGTNFTKPGAHDNVALCIVKICQRLTPSVNNFLMQKMLSNPQAGQLLSDI